MSVCAEVIDDEPTPEQLAEIAARRAEIDVDKARERAAGGKVLAKRYFHREDSGPETPADIASRAVKDFKRAARRQRHDPELLIKLACSYPGLSVARLAVIYTEETGLKIDRGRVHKMLQQANLPTNRTGKGRQPKGEGAASGLPCIMQDSVASTDVSTGAAKTFKVSCGRRHNHETVARLARSYPDASISKLARIYQEETGLEITKVSLRKILGRMNMETARGKPGRPRKEQVVAAHAIPRSEPSATGPSRTDPSEDLETAWVQETGTTTFLPVSFPSLRASPAASPPPSHAAVEQPDDIDSARRELDAMHRVMDALSPLSADEQRRVLSWFGWHHGLWSLPETR